MQARMLSKEDEAATGGEEIEVRREDQDRINRFSKLNQQEAQLEEDLANKQKEKEDLDDIANELELADEDELIKYKVGDTFLSLPLNVVQELLNASKEKIDKDVHDIEYNLEGLREELEWLKDELYARFGRSINLER